MKVSFKYDVAPLKRARLLKRWTPGQLAAKVGRSENMVRRIENGSRASEKTIFLMSEALGVPMEEIVVGGRRKRAS